MAVHNAETTCEYGLTVTASVHEAMTVCGENVLDQVIMNRCTQVQAEHFRLNLAGDTRSKSGRSAQERNSSSGKDRMVLRAAANRVGVLIGWVGVADSGFSLPIHSSGDAMGILNNVLCTRSGQAMRASGSNRPKSKAGKRTL